MTDNVWAEVAGAAIIRFSLRLSLLGTCEKIKTNKPECGVTKYRILSCQLQSDLKIQAS